MTYLDLVNNVLRRMREEEVASVSESTYSKMAGDFVNDAKKLVEAAWDWSALRTTLTITTSANIFNYVLVGSQNRIKALDVINDTSNFFMQYQPSSWFDDKYLNETPATGAPQYYTYNGIDSQGDSQIDVYPKPDGVYTLRFNCVLRNEDLTADTDQLLIPHMPVVHMAIALLARERGETGGTSTPEYFALADKYLSDAIALDAQKHPDETIWYAP
jgi:hypothetical protein